MPIEIEPVPVPIRYRREAPSCLLYDFGTDAVAGKDDDTSVQAISAGVAGPGDDDTVVGVA